MNPPGEERLRTIVSILQTDPGAYRAFGIYWWTIKHWLRRHYDTRTLFFLDGQHDDPACRKHVERLFGTPEELLASAVRHYNTKLEWGERYDGNSYFPDDDETYRLHDPDLGPANIRT